MIARRPRGLPILDASHASRWDIPDWTDPAGHYVYVAWSREHAEEALYVGVSSRILLRLAEHAQGSMWWADASHVDLHAFGSRADALRAEQDGIARLDPHWNDVRPGGAVHGDGCAICRASKPPVEACWSCGRPPSGRFRDGSPRFDCAHAPTSAIEAAS